MKYLLLLLMLFSSLVQSEDVKVFYKDTGKSFYEDGNRGWASYEKPIVEKKEDKEEVEKQESSSASVSPPVLTPREKLKEQGEQWENALATAILEPNRDTIIEYLGQTQKIMEQGQTFSTKFKEALWVTPEFDYKLTHPVTTQALVAKNTAQNALDDTALYDIGSDRALLYFYSSTCEYCKRFSPILKLFTEHYGIKVLAITLDGNAMPDFPNPRVNPYLVKKLKVTVTPSIFLVEPDKNKVAAVSYGFQSYTELTKRVLFANQELASPDAISVGSIQ